MSLAFSSRSSKDLLRLAMACSKLWLGSPLESLTVEAALVGVEVICGLLLSDFSWSLLPELCEVRPLVSPLVSSWVFLGFWWRSFSTVVIGGGF